MPFDVTVPETFLAQAARGAEWAAWLERLPRLLRDVIGEWELTPDGPVAHGVCAVVVPVRTAAGRAAALKVGWPHWEAETEHLALQRWHGDGAVELLRADPRRFALLLERAHTRDLTTLADLDACEVVAGLYARLHVPAGPPLRTLSSCVARWTDELEALPRSAPVPRRLVEQAVSLGRSFVADAATDGTLVHTDLHYENVLAADREPWLAIDPKPLSGDPHYEVAPLLWNRWAEAVGSGDVRWTVRRRLDTVVDAAGLDPDRARDWVVVRQMHNALWCLADASGRPGGLTDADRNTLTVAVAVAKAVQD